MKNFIVAGLIAGIGSGIVNFIFEVSGLYDLFSILPHVFPMDIQSMAIYSMIQYIVWGIIFSVFYSIVYDYIPSKGIRKGLIYSLIIWGIVILRADIIGAIHLLYHWAIPNAIAGFFSIGIVYGIILGVLYKPSK